MEETTAESPPLENCEACGGKTRQETIKLAIWSERGLVVVEDVPASVCKTCHEQTYDDDTASKLRQLASNGFSGQFAIREVSVPVFSLVRLGQTKPEEEASE